mmetsp:Transcript_7195/g.13752  ORF Transcript_7195/g.13752 Transcript_7195/m.13752 type:complete len:250 (-) Transcript_7195:136-885(-)|eukprot:scaffold3337_cov169-Amphora_coffeaeformis.AAC.23
MKNEYSAVSTVEGETLAKSRLDEYPGQRRSTIYAPLSSDRILIKTAGNALQAVPRAQLEQKNLIAVTVPGVLKPGDEILIDAPDGRIIRAEIPSTAVAGQVFFVHAPPTQVAATGIPIDHPAFNAGTGSGGTQVVAGEDIEKNDLTLQEEGNVESPHPAPFSESLSNNTTGSTHQSTNDDSNLILVQVPYGVSPGSTMRVKVPDGRTVEAVVPADPTVKEFYLRVPPKPQNWHNSPLAVAAAAATPYFV